MPARIMIAEDDALLAILLRYNLEAVGYEVEHVDRGDLVEERIAERRPSLLLLDWMLPGLSGVELCRRLRLTFPTHLLPIIIVTARVDREDRDLAVKVGANDFVTKPFALGDLLGRTRLWVPDPAAPIAC